MKAGWQSKPVGKVCEVVNGGTPKTKVPSYWGDQHLWITPAEMGKRESPFAADTQRKLTDEGLRNCSASLLPPNSVILSSRAPIGHLVINTEPMAFNQGCKGLVPSSDLHFKYLYYFLACNVDLLNSLGTGATFKELSAGKLKEVQIPFPSLPEQRRIVGILDEAFEGIAKAVEHAETNLNNARELFESHLNAIFSNPGPDWERRRLNDICTSVFAGGDVPKGNHSKTLTEKYQVPIYTNGEKNNGLYGYTDSARVTSPSITISARGTIGYTVIRNEPFYPAIRLIVATPNPDALDLSFLYFAIESMSIGHSGTSIPQLTVPMVRELLIPRPSLTEQRKLADQLYGLHAETKRLEAIYRQKLVLLAELKQSLLHKAFSGEL